MHRRNLIMIGYWDGPNERANWPPVEDFIDHEWDEDERVRVATFLMKGFVARSFMGISSCRICGKHNGGSDLTDGVYIWPEGLAHYVEDHGVRLPAEFVARADKVLDAIDDIAPDGDWWRSQQGNRTHRT